MAAEVFVSYSHHDQDVVLHWLHQLQTAGVSIWMDERGIDGAFRWAEEIVRAIEGCKVVLLMVSLSSAASADVVKEVSLARAADKPILPVLLEPVAVPAALRYHLVDIQYVELFRGDRELKLQAILRSLARLGVEVDASGRAKSQNAPPEAARPKVSSRRPTAGSAKGDLPSKPRARLAAPSHSARLGEHPHPDWPRAAFPTKPPGAAIQLALLYKRNAQPDEQLLRVLEARFRERGHKIFIDRHLNIGVEWAKEIERRLQSADAVIPLLSTASVDSEMLAYEIQIAHEAAQHQRGKPRLLPVRVSYTGSLPEPLASILEPLHHASWAGPEDDDRLVEELDSSLHDPTASRPTTPRPQFEPVGGAVPLDSEFYIVRPTDQEFRDAIARRDSLILVKGARQMGKTSLLARGLQQAREAGATLIRTDFQKLNVAHLESAGVLFRALAEWIAQQLDLDVLPGEVWNPASGANINFEWYLRREVLGKITTPIVWGMDEVDRLFDCECGGEVFGLFRSWHNERALDPDGPWRRLTLAIAYATEAHLFITDLNQSPFNVGTRLILEDFTLEQVADLNRRYGAPLRRVAEVARYYRLVGGHPYLVRRGLHEMAIRGIDLAAVEGEADRENGIFGDHLRRLLVALVKDPTLCDVVRNILQGEACPTAESFYRLRSAGLMSGESADDLRPRCQLYATYLERHLL